MVHLFLLSLYKEKGSERIIGKWMRSRVSLCVRKRDRKSVCKRERERQSEREREEMKDEVSVLYLMFLFLQK